MLNLQVIVFAFAIMACNPFGGNPEIEKRYLELDVSQLAEGKYDSLKIFGINAGSVDTIPIYAWAKGQKFSEKVFYPDEIKDVFEVVLQGRLTSGVWVTKSVWVNEAITSSILSAQLLDTNNSLSGDRLIAHWSFDEKITSTVKDISGNGLTGTLSGSPLIVQGKSGKALQFSGKVAGWDKLVIPSNNILNLTQAISVKFWVRIDSNIPGRVAQTLIQKGAVNNKVSPNLYHENFSIGSVDNKFYFQYVSLNSIVYSNGNFHFYEMTTPIKEKTWYQVGFRFNFGDPSSVAFFIGGTKVKGNWLYGSGKLAAVSNDYPLALGVTNTLEGGSFFPAFATLDEVCIWGRALKDSEFKIQ